MVSQQSVQMVEAALEKLGLFGATVTLGEVETRVRMSQEQHNQLKAALAVLGLELLDDMRSTLIEKIKEVIIEMVHDGDTVREMKYSVYISSKLNYDYTYLANIFSIATGHTIEHFIISQKIERVKEVLLNNEFTLTQISYKLNYSSVAHLSNQFKKVTGLTPSAFKRLIY